MWGPAPQSVGRYQYYVSFIDNFSKFTWIYLLRNRSEVFQVFLNFQQHVERLFNRKIITMQTDWGVEYQKLNSFFSKRLASFIMSLVLMLISKMARLKENIGILLKLGYLF